MSKEIGTELQTCLGIVLATVLETKLNRKFYLDSQQDNSGFEEEIIVCSHYK